MKLSRAGLEPAIHWLKAKSSLWEMDSSLSSESALAFSPGRVELFSAF